MADDLPRRHGSVVRLIGNPMGISDSAVVPQPSVAVCVPGSHVFEAVATSFEAPSQPLCGGLTHYPLLRHCNNVPQ